MKRFLRVAMLLACASLASARLSGVEQGDEQQQLSAKEETMGASEAGAGTLPDASTPLTVLTISQNMGYAACNPVVDTSAKSWKMLLGTYVSGQGTAAKCNQDVIVVSTQEAHDLGSAFTDGVLFACGLHP